MTPPIDSRAPGPQAKHAGGAPQSLEERLDQVYRSRRLFSLWLLPPLAFFIFLVAWFREGFILIAVGVAIYAYMLAQFFIFQNPARRARKAALREGSKPDASA